MESNNSEICIKSLKNVYILPIIIFEAEFYLKILQKKKKRKTDSEREIELMVAREKVYG